MRALQFTEFGSASKLRLVELPDPKPDSKTAIVKVAAGAISPSDVKNVEGKMEGTTLPRVPGRDYAGTVIHGPAEWVGTEVWGTGGEIGYSSDGSHAELIAVPVASLRRKPKTLSMEQAAAIGVTYLAAWLGVIEYAQLASGETLLVTGAGGGPMFEPSLEALARRGRQLAITSAGDRRVSFDLLDFYHNESRLFGVDTRHRNAVASAALLDALTPVFEQGAFKAPKIDRVIPLSDGPAAYEQVARGTVKGRLVLVP
jgi:NADPH:quinone reductase-like Zn-dependent oxidoreductase